MSREAQTARSEGSGRGHKNAESGLHGASETRFPGRGEHHGPVRPSQRHPPGGGANQELPRPYSYRVHGERSFRLLPQGKFQELGLLKYVGIQPSLQNLHVYK